MGHQGVLEAGGHEGWIAGLLDQMVEQARKLAGFGGLDEQALADARGERHQVGAAEFAEQAQGEFIVRPSSRVM